MQLSQIFKILHNKIEAQLFGDRITNKEMAEKLGCYSEKSMVANLQKAVIILIVKEFSLLPV